MTLEEILKANGYTEEDLKAQETLLKDARFRGALEKTYGATEEQLESYKSENEKWAKWHEDHGKPTLELYEKERNDALADRASLAERLRLAEEAGYSPRGTATAVAATPAAPVAEAFDPKKHNLVTKDDITKFSDMEGRAIAMAADLNEQYRYLTAGKSLYDYTTERDGRQVRGLTALREEAIAARKPLDQYVSEKFDFRGKQDAIAAKQRQEQEEKIRADERGKIMSQFGNPDTRPLTQSQRPFMPVTREGGKQPWEIDRTKLRSERLERAVKTQYSGGVQ